MMVVSVIRRNSALITKISRFLGYFLLFIGLGYQTQRLYRKLKIEPEIFSKESSIQSSKIPFPAVTFCSPNPVRNEAWTPETLGLNNLTKNDLIGATLQTCPNHDMLMEYQSSDANFVDVLLKSSPNFADVIYQCGLNKYLMGYQDCDKLFVRSITAFGICYTFNMLGHDLVFNKAVSSDFNTLRRTRIAKIWNPDEAMNDSRYENDTEPPTWTIEDGYLGDGEFLQPARALKMQTLLIGVFNNVNDSFCESRERNYKMMLHLPNELPQISYETVNVPLGKEVTVLITAEVTQNEDSLRNFKPEKRGCYFEGEKQLQVFKSYTKANCEYECMTSFVNSTCGCVKFSMPRSQDTKVCDFDQHSCITTITGIFPRSYYDNNENKKKFPDYPCGCLPSCTEIKYKIIKSESKKSEFASDTQEFAVINAIFADSQIKRTTNYVTYDIENFLFDIGGLVGLFLGSSILSVLELLVGIFRKVKSYTEKVRNIVRLWTEQGTEEVQVRSGSGSIATICRQELEIEDLSVGDLEY